MIFKERNDEIFISKMKIRKRKEKKENLFFLNKFFSLPESLLQQIAYDLFDNWEILGYNSFPFPFKIFADPII